MNNDKDKSSEPTPENVAANANSYNPANRDFQRTEDDLDSVSESEKETVEKLDESLKQDKK